MKKLLFGVLFFFLFVFSSLGPNSSVSTVYFRDDANGNVAWQHPGNALHQDGSYATSYTFIDTAATNYLVGAGFFDIGSIPLDATITGVQAEASIAIDIFGDNSRDASVLLQNAIDFPAIGGSDLGGAYGSFTTSLTYYSWGGDGQMWGLAITPAMVNTTDFGFGLMVSSDGGTTVNFNVDHMRMTIYYTEPSGVKRHLIGEARTFKPLFKKAA